MFMPFLIGDRRAILALAGDPRLPWVGAVLVAAAALARCYDREDLAHEPWHLLVPFGASLGTAALILGAVLVLGWRRWQGTAPGFAHARAFLGLFWCTAPLAWAYAIPWEHLLVDQASAVSANLTTLKIVSVWRVLLMIRVVIVLFGVSWWDALVIVLGVADLVLLATLRTVPVPIFAIMGGVIQDEAVRRLAEDATTWWILGHLALAPLAVGLIAVVCVRVPRWTAATLLTAPAIGPWPLRAALVVVAGCAALLPVFQPAQRARYAIYTLDRGGDQVAVVRTLAGMPRDALPPDWHLPPAAIAEDAIARWRTLADPTIPAWVVAEVMRNRQRDRDIPSAVVATALVAHPEEIPNWRHQLSRLQTDLDEPLRSALRSAIARALPESP